MKHILTIDPREPRSAWAFTLFLCAISCALAVTGSYSGLTWVILPFILLVAVAESVPVTLPHSGQSVSVSFAIGYAIIILFDPAPAALAAGVGMVLANISQRKPLNIWLFNGVQIYIASYCSSLLWRVMPGGLDHGATLFESIPWFFFTAVAFFILNIAMTTVSVSLAFDLPMREVLVGNVKWGVPNVAVLWTVGILIIFLFRGDAGLIGVLFLWLPLLVVRYSFQQYVQLKQTHIETIQSLAATLDAKDPYTHGHSQRVADIAMAIARKLQLSTKDLEAVHYAGLLHDIGKIGVQDEVLNKEGRLTEEEWEKIRSHATIGADIVKRVRFLDGVSAIIRHHHESYDGTGYPDGLKGEEIPLGARILGVADAFDAMTTERPYRKALSLDIAVAELKRNSGQQFDPRVVQAFIESVIPEMEWSDAGQPVFAEESLR